MKFGQLIKYDKRSNFLQKIMHKMSHKELVLDLFLFFEKAINEVKASGQQLSFNIVR